jgi:rubrerythrin
MVTPSLLDAIRVVKENERVASERYAAAVQEINNPIGKQLFQELSKFEKFHFEKVSALLKSLEEQGKYINYEGKEFPLPPTFEIKAAEKPNQKSDVTIIAQAIDLEKQAEKAYSDLAAQITDPQGHEMFNRLSEEEYKHYLLLREAYWTVTNLGVWKWVQPKKT